MSALPIAAKMLRAAQLAYNVTASGALDVEAPFDQIGWIGEPQGFAVGAARINAALVGETESEIIVAFRGTLPPTSASPDDRQVLLDWVNDLDAAFAAGDHLPGLVHRGFLAALDELWSGVSAAIPKGKPLFFVGHSKGGALANLAAARYVALNPQPLPPIVVTFGGAKPGDRAFQLEYDLRVPHSVRYENRDDVVPHLPPGDEFRTMFRNVPVFAQGLADVVSGYVGVGELKFIGWDGLVIADSSILRFQRYLSLAQLAATFHFRTVILDHTSGDDGGYAAAVLPPSAGFMVSQATPGVSRVA